MTKLFSIVTKSMTRMSASNLSKLNSNDYYATEMVWFSQEAKSTS